METHPIHYGRAITVYVPAQYVPGTAAPFIVTHDGPGMGRPDRSLPHILDNLIAQKRLPLMLAIMVAHGGGDAQGHERGLEYDTMSGKFAAFIETEVLPEVEKNYSVKLTKDPDGRATMGGSSGGSAALEMAWYHPDLYHRVITYSGTYVNQQWTFNAETPDGAWDFHMKNSSPAARSNRSVSGWKSATATCSTLMSCATTCTTGWSPTTAWPRCCGPKATITNTASP